MFGFKGTSVVESTGVQYKSAAPKTKIKRLVSLNRTRNFNFDLVLHYYIKPPPIDSDIDTQAYPWTLQSYSIF